MSEPINNQRPLPGALPRLPEQGVGPAKLPPAAPAAAPGPARGGAPNTADQIVGSGEPSGQTRADLRGPSGLTTKQERSVATDLSSAAGVQLPPPGQPLIKAAVVETAARRAAQNSISGADVLARINANPMSLEDLTPTNWAMAIATLMQDQQKQMQSATKFKFLNMLYSGIGELASQKAQMAFDKVDIDNERMKSLFDLSTIQNTLATQEAQSGKAALLQEKAGTSLPVNADLSERESANARPTVLAQMGMQEALRAMTQDGVISANERAAMRSQGDKKPKPGAKLDEDMLYARRPVADVERERRVPWPTSDLPDGPHFSEALRREFAAAPLKVQTLLDGELEQLSPANQRAFKELRTQYDRESISQPVRLAHLEDEQHALTSAADRCMAIKAELSRPDRASPANTAACRALDEHAETLFDRASTLEHKVASEQHKLDVMVDVQLRSREAFYLLMHDRTNQSRNCAELIADLNKTANIIKVQPGDHHDPHQPNPILTEQRIKMLAVQNKLQNLDALDRALHRCMKRNLNFKSNLGNNGSSPMQKAAQKLAKLDDLIPGHNLAAFTRGLVNRFASGHNQLGIETMGLFAEAANKPKRHDKSDVPTALSSRAQATRAALLDLLPDQAVAAHLLSERFARAQHDQAAGNNPDAVAELRTQLLAARKVAPTPDVHLARLQPADLVGSGDAVMARLAALMQRTSRGAMGKHVDEMSATQEQALPQLQQTLQAAGMTEHHAQASSLSLRPVESAQRRSAIAAEAAFWQEANPWSVVRPTAPAASLSLGRGGAVATPRKRSQRATEPPVTPAQQQLATAAKPRATGADSSLEDHGMDDLQNRLDRLMARGDAGALMASTYNDHLVHPMQQASQILEILNRGLPSADAAMGEKLQEATGTSSELGTAKVSEIDGRGDEQRNALRGLAQRLSALQGAIESTGA